MRISGIVTWSVAGAPLLAAIAAVLVSTQALAQVGPPLAQVGPPPAGSPSAPPAPAFTSEAYAYTVPLPPGWLASPAAVTWDGQSQIDSGGMYTDRLSDPQGESMFVFGAPTMLSTDAFAAQQQAWTARWHDCPATPDDARDATLDGHPAWLHAFLCQGVQVFKLMAVADGVGLVVNQITSPGTGMPCVPTSWLGSRACVGGRPPPAAQRRRRRLRGRRPDTPPGERSRPRPPWVPAGRWRCWS